MAPDNMISVPWHNLQTVAVGQWLGLIGGPFFTGICDFGAKPNSIRLPETIVQFDGLIVRELLIDHCWFEI
jgi:hypothetical protein